MSYLNLKEVRQWGFDRGYGIASWQDLPEIGQKVDRSIDWVGVGPTIQDVDSAEEYFLCLCSSAEENNRCYSPFEFTAKEFNEADNSEAVWEAYQEGIGEGFQANWAKRARGYYTEGGNSK